MMFGSELFNGVGMLFNEVFNFCKNSLKFLKQFMNEFIITLTNEISLVVSRAKYDVVKVDFHLKNFARNK